jgi:hypothetical protein
MYYLQHKEFCGVEFSMADRKPVLSERIPGRHFDLFETELAETRYADGTVGFSMGPAVSRIEFYRVISVRPVNPTEVHEDREKHLIVTLPTVALLEFLKTATGGAERNKDGILKGSQDLLNMYKRLLEKPVT